MSNGKDAKRFSLKLYGYSHLHYLNMMEICKRAPTLTPVLKQALNFA